MSLAKPGSLFGQGVGQIVRFSLAGRLPHVSATVAVAKAFRAAALSALHAVTGTKESFLLSGHKADGRPDDQHRHAYYLPIPDQDGRLAELLIVSPEASFSSDELAAISVVKRIQFNGPSSALDVELVEENSRVLETLATRWESTTPYVPPRRFWGTHGKKKLTPERQLARELRELAIPSEVTNCSVNEWMRLRVRIVLNPELEGNPQSHIRSGFRVQFETREPLVGPLALGHSAHFGLGQFWVPPTND